MNEYVSLKYKGCLKGSVSYFPAKATPIYDVWILTNLISRDNTLEDISSEKEPFHKIKKAPDGA